MSHNSPEFYCGNLENDPRLGPISQLCSSSNMLLRNLLEYEVQTRTKYEMFNATRKAILDSTITKKSISTQISDADRKSDNLDKRHRFIKTKIGRLYSGIEALTKEIGNGEVLDIEELNMRRSPIVEDGQKLRELIGSILDGEINELLSRTDNELSQNLPALSIREKQLNTDARTAHITWNLKQKQLSTQFEDMMEELAILRLEEDTQPENMILGISNTLNSIKSVGNRVFSKKVFVPFTEPITELQTSAGKGKIQSSRLSSLKEEMRNELAEIEILMTNVSELKVEGKAAAPNKESLKHETSSSIAKSLAHISRPPVVEIFELKPPFILTESDLASVQAVQSKVAREFTLFRQPENSSLTNACSATEFTDLNTWQRFLYHYFHPFQDSVPGLLVAASAGAGKSWAIAHLSSTWGRAGRRVSVATKESLRDDIYDAMFRSLADFNINNLVNGFNVDIGKTEKSGKNEDLVNTPLSMKELKMKGYALLRDMGVSWVHPTSGSGIWTLIQLNNIIEADWPQHKKMGGPENFPLEGALLQFDEAHRLITPKQDLIGPEVPNYKLLLMELFRHRKNKPVTQWPRVVLHTATPVASAPVDPIRLLNLLVDRKSAWLDFMFENATTAELLADPDALGRELDSVEMNSRFLRDYVNDDGTLNGKGARKWDTLAAGKISYVNMYGDRNRFPQPDFPMTIVTEELSEKQTSNILCCLGYKKTNCLAGTDMSEDDESSIGSLATGAATKTKKKGVTKKKADKILSDDSVVESAQDKMTECALKETVSPRTTGVKDISKLSWVDRATKYAPNVIHLVNEMIGGIRKEQIRYGSIRSNAYATGRTIPKNLPFNSKIFLYIAHSCRGKSVTSMIYGILTENNFECLNPTDKPIRTDIPPYRAYINHTGPLGKGLSKQLRDIYNSKENADGKIALIFCSSSKHREGISLYNVKKVYVAGTEGSEANLVQAVARAVRYCSHDDSLWDPLKGWTVQVYVQRLVWYKALKQDPTAKIKLQDSFNKMLQAINPNGMKFYRCLDHMTRLVGASGADMGLFGKLNSLGNGKDGKSKINLPL